jgi:hypothetical protein
MRLGQVGRSIFLGFVALPLTTANAAARIGSRPVAFSQFTVELPEKDVHNSVRGKVVDPLGSPIGGSLVEIVDTETQKVVASQTTEQSGEFHFESLPLGDHFRLRARKDGFCPLEIPLHVTQHQGARRLKLKLVVAA